MKHTFYGLLTYNDNGEYKIDDLNMSELLYDIYYNNAANTDLSVIRIKITNANRTLINEDGELYLAKNKYGFYSYHVNDIDIEEVLFNATDTVVDMVINVEELSYGCNKNKKS